MTLNNKGFYFSIEMLLSFVVILLVFLLLFSFIITKINSRKDETQRIKLYINTIKFMDSIVKSADLNYGAATQDLMKERIKENILSMEKLKRINFAFFDKLGIQTAYFKVLFEDANIVTLLENTPTSDCVLIERFVLIENKKALIKIKNCLSD